MEVGLIILSGGKSSRMGTDKAFLPLGEKSFIQWIMEKGEQWGFTKQVIVANELEKYQGLGKEVIQDIYPQLGPLSGIHAGLSHMDCTYNLVVPCDAPFVSFESLKELVQYAHGENKAIVPTAEGRYQPLMAIYHTDCIPVIEQMLLVDQEYKLRKLFDRVVTKVVAMDNQEVGFMNINTPEELEKAKALVETQKGR